MRKVVRTPLGDTTYKSYNFDVAKPQAKTKVLVYDKEVHNYIFKLYKISLSIYEKKTNINDINYGKGVKSDFF